MAKVTSYFPSPASFTYPKYAHVKNHITYKGKKVGLGVFTLSHSDLLEGQSPRNDIYDGQ